MFDENYWIGLYLPETQPECNCNYASVSVNECEACRSMFVWVDGSLSALDAWNDDDEPSSGRRCVVLQPDGLWSAMECHNAQFRYICKKGIFSVHVHVYV